MADLPQTQRPTKDSNAALSTTITVEAVTPSPSSTPTPSPAPHKSPDPRAPPPHPRRSRPPIPFPHPPPFPCLPTLLSSPSSLHPRLRRSCSPYPPTAQLGLLRLRGGRRAHPPLQRVRPLL